MAEPTASQSDQAPAPGRVDRCWQGLLLAGLGWSSWMGMMLVHEAGHVAGAWATGGVVRAVVWSPTSFSSTHVWPNPSPGLVAWAGPIMGVILPSIFAAGVLMARVTRAYLAVFFAGFCLLANGAYLGLGVIEGVGDAGDLLRHGMPAWLLIAFGCITAPAGLLLWQIASPNLGFGHQPKPIRKADAIAACIVAALLTASAWATHALSG